jgi:hypothetical protein
MAIKTILGGATPNLSIEHLENGAFVASGFDVLSARVLLDFCERFGINCRVLFQKASHCSHKSFQILFFYEFEECGENVETAEAGARVIALESLCLDEKERHKLRALNALLPAHTTRADIVTFPRVLHVKIHCSHGVTASELDALQRAPSVREVRLGGLSQSIEVILRRASRFERHKPKRALPTRTRNSAKTCATRRVRSMLSFDEA